jgi:hypothetical protein
MAKKLISVEANGNADRFGGSDYVTTHAISDDEQKLIDYCKDTFDMPVGKPEKFSWKPFYLIQETKIVIV